MKTTKSHDKQDDDLTMIKGIGEATERNLKQALDIEKAGDLAMLSVDEIEAGLKESGRTVSRVQIEEWLSRARELVEGAAESVPSENLQSQAADANDSYVTDDQTEWRSAASFVVEFQERASAGEARDRRTTVHHMKDGQERTWPGVAGDEPWRWMLNRTDVELPTDTAVSTPDEHSAEAETAEPHRKATPVPRRAERQSNVLEITRLRAFQPPDSDTPLVIGSARHAVQATVRGGQPVSFEITVQVKGSVAGEATLLESPMNAEIYTYNRSTAAKTWLHESNDGTDGHGDSSFNFMMPETVMERGTYRLDCLATVEGASPLQGYLEVPVLRVV